MAAITGNLTVTENVATLSKDGSTYILVPAKGANPCSTDTQYDDDDVADGVAYFRGRSGQITVNGCFTTLTDAKVGAIAYNTQN